LKKKITKIDTPTDFYCMHVEFGTPEYDETVALRDRILRKPLGIEFSEDKIAQEYDSLHLALYGREGELLACLVMTPKGDGRWKMRQVAVEEFWQGKGIGKQLVLWTERQIKLLNGKIIELHARDIAIPFYLKLAYELEGEPFEEVGIPHRAMIKHLEI
jgi:predicted GNAT family N-acyltransferase